MCRVDHSGRDYEKKYKLVLCLMHVSEPRLELQLRLLISDYSVRGVYFIRLLVRHHHPTRV